MSPLRVFEVLIDKMWTKHYTSDGKAYYYNAAQDRSLWHAPKDSIIHEAVNLVNPTTLTTVNPPDIVANSSQIDSDSTTKNIDADADEFLSSILPMKATST